MVNVTDFDIQEYLDDSENVIYFLDAALEANDPPLVYYSSSRSSQVPGDEGTI
ncbi:hypothetical protein ACFQY8_01070 [Alloscardovia venturai]|uniref:Uncharacterized protein n=1 Tax=Alloscardovia venturai TaxID=1769421 RepID=A0ABW2Y2T1_9BIFI